MHPALAFLGGAMLIPFLRGRAKKVFIALVPAAALAGTLLPRTVMEWGTPVPGLALTLFYGDRLSLFAEGMFVLSAMLIVLYSLHVEQDAFHITSFLYIGSSLAVVLAGDLVTLLVFWKLLSIAPAVLIWLKGDEGSLGAGFSYLMVHLAGSTIMLVGVAIHWSDTGSLSMEGLAGLPMVLILTSIGFKAAFIPVHTWLPDAYSRASFTASVLLSVFTTKTAVYSLARSFSGLEAVAYMGAVMALYGVVWALRQSNARKLLSYHIISQVGYMVAAIGIGTQLGIDAGLSHAWNNVLYKTLLFMCVGAVIYRTGKQDLADMGGLLRRMPVTTAACIVAALSISGVPPFNGYVSKAMIYEAAGPHAALYWMLKLTSLGTAVSFCKFAYFGFLRKREVQVSEAPLHMTVPMVIMAALCVAGGIYPALLSGLLPYQSRADVFSAGKLLDAMLVLGAAGMAFLLGIRLLQPHRRETWDVDCLYAGLVRGLARLVRNPGAVLSSLVDTSWASMAKVPLGAVRCLAAGPVPGLAAGADRLSSMAEAAGARGREKRARAALGPPAVDARSLESALFLVAAMLSFFLLYATLGHLAPVWRSLAP